MGKKLLRHFGLIFPLVFILMASGCRPGTIGNAGVTVTIEPVKYFIDRLTSENIQVNVMVPMGSSPATYSPTTAQFAELSSSGLYVQVGHLGFESTWMDRMKELNPEMEVLDLSDGVDLVRGDNSKIGNHVHHGGIEPHIWMSPKIVKSFLPRLKNQLEKSFPDQKAIIQRNFKGLMDDVESLDHAFSDLPEDKANRKFMIFHPALTYLARDYGFGQISIEYEGKEPSPGKLRELIDRANNEKINIIFIQAEFDKRNAQMVRQATGARLITINPLSYNWIVALEEIYHVLADG
jgi:zinc transport system substrate-binding protein